MNHELNAALAMARGLKPAEKVPVSVQVPKDIKEEFQALCSAEHVSMSSMIVSLMGLCVVEYQPTSPDQDEVDDKTPTLPGME